MLSPNSRPAHWTVLAGAKRRYRAACHLQAISQGLRRLPGDAMHVRVTFVPPDRRRRDLDNLVAAMKSAMDALADVTGIDDSRWTYTHTIDHDRIGGMVEVSLEAA